MKYICSKAYAKINLALDITGLDGRGYHLVESVMKKISLADDIFICTEEGIGFLSSYSGKNAAARCSDVFDSMRENGSLVSVACSNPYVPCDGSNLAYKAADLFFGESGISEPVFIYIRKRIPVGGGLAGGSTDAAGVLRSLNILFGNPLSYGTLVSLASRLGSDVPFFLQTKPALVTGTGTEVRPLPSFPPMNILIVNPGFSSSTEKAYKMYDSVSIPEDAHPDCGRLINALTSGDIVSACGDMKNVLEFPVFSYLPKIGALKNKIASADGALTSFMSGSGSTVVGIFADKDSLAKAADIFKKFGYGVWTVR